MDIFSLLVLLFHWLMEAAVRYNATPEGEAALKDVLDGLEALGFDVPFYTPTDQQGAPLDMSAARAADSSDVEMAKAFQARHPELFPQEGQGS